MLDITPEMLDSSTRRTLTTSLLRCGSLLLQTLDVASMAVIQAPTLDDRAGALERARELLLQLEHAAALYRDLCGADLLQHAKRLTAHTTLPASWLEVAIAQLLLGYAAHFALLHQLQLTRVPSEATRFALACQAEHCSAARAALDELHASSATGRANVRTSMDYWLSVSLAALDEGEIRRRYLIELERVTRDLGLAH